MHSCLISHLACDRRTALKASLGLGLAAWSAPGSGLATPGGTNTPKHLDYADPADNLYAFGKIWAGYGEPVTGAFHGLM